MKLKTAPRSGNVVLEMRPDETSLPPINIPELGLKTILVPVDFSECSRKALDYAVPFAKQFNAEIILLNVIETVPPPPMMVVVESEAVTAKMHEHAARMLADWRNNITAVTNVKAVVRSGMAAHQEIIDAARDNNVDLIIVGTHGRSGFAHLLLGSTAERVVRHAPCPVLIVREREHDFVKTEEAETREE